MFGRVLKTKAEMEAELENDRKKQRIAEAQSGVASMLDDMAIEVSIFIKVWKYDSYFI